jgi:hypothetical protein
MGRNTLAEESQKLTEKKIELLKKVVDKRHKQRYNTNTKKEIVRENG